MLCSNCMMAMDSVDDALCLRVARSNDNEMEGTIERWVCVHCGYKESTKLIDGCRETIDRPFVSKNEKKYRGKL